MALSTFVIIRNVSNLSDARYCAGMGADVLGFVLEPGQPGAISKEAFTEITGWVAGAMLMGEFTHANVAEINLAVNEFDLDLVLINQEWPAEKIEQIQVPVIQRLEPGSMDSYDGLVNRLRKFQDAPAYFLISLEDQNQLSDSVIEVLRKISEEEEFMLLLSGSAITSGNVQQLLHDIDPAGLCLQGGHELKPGLRNFDDLAEILELLEQDS